MRRLTLEEFRNFSRHLDLNRLPAGKYKGVEHKIPKKFIPKEHLNEEDLKEGVYTHIHGGMMYGRQWELTDEDVFLVGKTKYIFEEVVEIAKQYMK